MPTPFDRAAAEAPSGYVPDDGLKAAVEVALLLGQPLLLTGEPGTGKTQLATWLADREARTLLKFETKSTTVAADLFYTYDALGRFHAAQSGASADVLDYLSFNALGRAILLANPAAHADLLREKHAEPTRTVVLIDEVDKAPRDLPNDVLNELDGLFFRIPEVRGRVVAADPAFRPVVVFTSNSEKNLPDAFLRRCAYYHIPFPAGERLELIVTNRLGKKLLGDGPFLKSAIDLFERFRAGRLRKKPATAELLGWVRVLRAISQSDDPFRTLPKDRVLGTLAAVAKTPEDLAAATQVCETWLTTPKG